MKNTGFGLCITTAWYKKEKKGLQGARIKCWLNLRSLPEKVAKNKWNFLQNMTALEYISKEKFIMQNII